MENSKILKALKLMALSLSDNPHEAANAKQKLQALQLAHQITIKELKDYSFFRSHGYEITLSRITGRHIRELMRTAPELHTFTLAALCVKVNGQTIDQATWTTIPKPAQESIERALIDKLTN